MRVLELFCGTKSISHAFERQGHTTFTVDNDPQHEADLCMDIMDFKPDMVPWPPDVVWASPPCNCFSTNVIYLNWRMSAGRSVPARPECEAAIEVVKHTLNIIRVLDPKYWFMENPRALLRMQKLMRGLPRRTVTYCQYGENYMKPTDIWTNCSPWYPKSPCNYGDKCHEYTPRGANTGARGRGAKDAGRIPVALCDEIVMACEKEPPTVPRFGRGARVVPRRGYRGRRTSGFTVLISHRPPGRGAVTIPSAPLPLSSHNMYNPHHHIYPPCSTSEPTTRSPATRGDTGRSPSPRPCRYLPRSAYVMRRASPATGWWRMPTRTCTSSPTRCSGSLTSRWGMGMTSPPPGTPPAPPHRSPRTHRVIIITTSAPYP